MTQRNYRLPTLKSRLHTSRTEVKPTVAPQRQRATAGERGYDARWRTYRLGYLASNPFCVMGGEGCTLVATVVDHITPHRGDRVLFWDVANHQSLCAHCHNEHKQRQEHADRYGR